jgi:acetoin utilization protein AcuC
MTLPLNVSYSSDYLNWKLGSGNGSHPTNPIRALNALNLLKESLGDAVKTLTPVAHHQTREDIESVHDTGYVASVIDEGRSGEWGGVSRENADTAQVMFEGTRILAHGIVSGDIEIGFNPQGAKHHAHFDRASGFCVFNDMAWAAKYFQSHGLKPLYLDWDAHAGDGVQGLLLDTDIPTMSIHNGSIFPGDPQMSDPSRAGVTHTRHLPDRHAYNWALATRAGDDELIRSVNEALEIGADYEPDVILLATGADGHLTDPLGALGFDYPGYRAVAEAVARFAKTHAKSRVLIGGAGGYQPDDHTPKVWTTVVETMYRALADEKAFNHRG